MFAQRRRFLPFSTLKSGCAALRPTGYTLMIQTVEAVIEVDGQVRLLGEVNVTGPRRALVTVLEEPAVPREAVLLAEAALSDWSRSEEDAAWSHLQSAK
jgi:hypothetical protein